MQNETIAKSLALRLLIHYIGDISQPLHALTRITKNRPSGDFGGNLFEIPQQYDIANLHAVWDSLMYIQDFKISDKFPLSNESYQQLQLFTNNLT